MVGWTALLCEDTGMATTTNMIVLRLVVRWMGTVATTLLLVWSAGVAGHPAGEPIDTTVMSFNIRYGAANDGANSWPHRRELVRRTIASHQPAIFGVQECLWDQAVELRQQFPDYRFTGAGRNDGEQAGEMCALFVSRSRYRVLDQGVFWLSQTPDVPGSKGWDAALPRITTWVKLQDLRCVPETLFVFNTHFDHAGSYARQESAKLLRDRLARIAGEAPVILMGDFNDPAGDPTPSYGVLVGGDKRNGLLLYDTWSQASREQRMQGEGTFHGFSGEAIRGRIDWILTSGGLPVIDAGIDRLGYDGRYPSDHFPVWATLRLARLRH